MDLYEIIRTLHEERERLNRIIRRIQELEQRHPSGKASRRRGLTPRDRREISRRLRGSRRAKV